MTSDGGQLDSTIPGTGGLVVEWTSRPATWPSDIGDGITVERAIFAFDSMRVVGDAGDDPRTTRMNFEVRWDASAQPETIRFDDAPSGLYSQVSLLADGHLSTESVKLRGTVTVDSETRDFEVDIDEALAVNVQVEEMLTPPNVATIRLRVDFEAALKEVDWSSVPIDDGRRDLGDSDPQMPKLREKLVAGFQIVDDGGGGSGGAPVQ